MDKSYRSLVSDCRTLPLGRQLDLFYNGTGVVGHSHDPDAGRPNWETSREPTRIDYDDNRGEPVTGVRAPSATDHPAPPRELSLPPIQSPTVWRVSDAAAADPAFIYEPEVPLSDLPSPGRRFPLLGHTRRCGHAVPTGRIPQVGTMVEGRRNRPSRARMLCPTSNCRLISLSWDDNYFIDDDDRLTSKSCGFTNKRYLNVFENKPTETSLAGGINGFPKRKPVAGRAKCAAINDDLMDVVRCRKQWKELTRDKRRFSENDWRRENTGLLMKHISLLISNDHSEV